MYTYIYIYTYRMGLAESSLTQIIKQFSFWFRCKVSCDSPCCQGLFGDNNHRNCNIDTHECVSDSDEDEDNKCFKIT